MPTRRDEQQPAALVVRDPESILRYAVDKGANVETIERLMAVRRELKAEQAKEAFDAAMSAFQTDCPVIVKTKFGAKNAYKYAPLDDILTQVRDLIRKHGFSFSITSEIEPGWVMAKCKITHAGGHSEVSEFKVPVDKNNTLMTDPQRYGGSMTFSKRYAFCNGFGILTADEDRDGDTTRQKPPGPSTLAADESVKKYAQQLWTLLKPVRGSDPSWVVSNQWLWRMEILDGAIPESAPDLSIARFREVIAAATEKLK